MKNLKQTVINRGWAEIKKEHFGTILISKNIFNWLLFMNKRIFFMANQ